MDYNEGMKKQLYFCLISSLALCSCGTDRRRWEKLILPFQAHDVLRVNIDEVNTEYSFESGHYQYFSNNTDFIETVYQVVVTTPVIAKNSFKNYKCEKFLSIYFELADGIYDRKCLASWGSYILYNDKIYFNGVNFASNLFHDINCEQLKGKFEKITIA